MISKYFILLFLAVLAIPFDASAFGGGKQNYNAPFLSTIVSAGIENQGNIVLGINLGPGVLFRRTDPNPRHGYRREKRTYLLTNAVYERVHSIGDTVYVRTLYGGGVEFARLTQHYVGFDAAARLLFIDQQAGYQLEAGVIKVLGGFILPAELAVSYTHIGEYEAMGCALRFDLSASFFLMFF